MKLHDLATDQDEAHLRRFHVSLIVVLVRSSLKDIQAASTKPDCRSAGVGVENVLSSFRQAPSVDFPPNLHIRRIKGLRSHFIALL